MRMGLALLGIAVASTASAQNGRSAQAVMHIRINIVPVVQTPRAPEAQQTGIVTYNVPTHQTSMDVMEKTSVLPGSAVGGGAGVGSVVLHTLTVVPK
jgi:hypothetical protein